MKGITRQILYSRQVLALDVLEPNWIWGNRSPELRPTKRYGGGGSSNLSDLHRTIRRGRNDALPCQLINLTGEWIPEILDMNRAQSFN